MSDNPTAEQSQVDSEGQQSQVDTPKETTTTQAVEVTTTKAASSVDDLPKWARDEIKEFRRKEASQRVADKERSQAEQTEAQTLRSQLEELTPQYSDLQTKYNTLRAQIALIKAGADEEFVDLLAPQLDASVLDDDDKTQEAIDKLRQQRPRGFRVASLDGGARGSTTVTVEPGLSRIRHAIENNPTPNRR